MKLCSSLSLFALPEVISCAPAGIITGAFTLGVVNMYPPFAYAIYTYITFIGRSTPSLNPLIKINIILLLLKVRIHDLGYISCKIRIKLADLGQYLSSRIRIHGAQYLRSKIQIVPQRNAVEYYCGILGLHL